MLKEQCSTWATTLKENSKLRGSDPRHPDDHEEFSHLLTSINWWSSQKEKTTHKHTSDQKG